MQHAQDIVTLQHTMNDLSMRMQTYSAAVADGSSSSTSTSAEKEGKHAREQTGDN